MNKIIKTCKISAFLVTLLAACSTVGSTNDDYAGFPQPQADFAAHVQEVESYLLATQMPQRTVDDARLNLPFELSASKQVSYRGKFLLIHGLNDSPYVWRDTATQLSTRGYDVRAILLPGHGNSPKAQLTMSYKRWLTAAREQLDIWAGDDQVPMYLGGFSLGGVIATGLAFERDDITGLLLFSPAYKSSKNHLVRWSSIYSRFKPWVFGGMIIEDNPTKYNSIPINGVAQYHKTTKYLNKVWRRKKLDVPVLIVASENDSVVDIANMKKMFNKKFSSAKKKLLLYSTQPDAIEAPNVVYRKSVYPELRVLNQSHQSAIIAPENPLFGNNGSVLVCNGNDWPTFSACLYSSEDHWFAAQHTPSPDGAPVARATYNPDFHEVFNLFEEVFD